MDTVLRRPPKQQRSRGRVEEILNAAKRLIGEKGIDAVKMREIAALAGGPISSVYQYFPNKSAIIATLFQLWSEEIEDMVATRMRDIGSIDDLCIAAADLLDYFLNRMSEDPAGMDLLNAIQADKTLMDLDVESTRRQADRFCEAGRHLVAPERYDDFKRVTFLMFQLSLGAVRLAMVEAPNGDWVLNDYKAIIHAQILAFAEPKSG